MAVADRKLRSIREILRNETYLVNSGLYQRLETALNRLPADVLSDLNVLVCCRMREAQELRARIDAELADPVPPPHITKGG